MASHKRIQNVTTGFWLKPSSVAIALRECAVEWVEEGVSVRNLSLQEAYDARVAHAAKRQYVDAPLPSMELPGTRFERPKQTTYRAPWKVYEETAEPVCISYCRWPRAAAA